MAAVPTTPKGQRTREQILRAARRVFAHSGYVAARMSDVADEADLSLGGLYRYFTNKEDLFAEMIRDVHDELYEASRSGDHDFADEPFEALLSANRGYLQLYFDNRDVMRAFIEASTVDANFREIWWKMRNRHIDRFVDTMKSSYAGRLPERLDIPLAAEAMACMVEQTAYVWFAHEEMRKKPVSVKRAAETVTRAWHHMFFPER